MPKACPDKDYRLTLDLAGPNGTAFAKRGTVQLWPRLGSVVRIGLGRLTHAHEVAAMHSHPGWTDLEQKFRAGCGSPDGHWIERWLDATRHRLFRRTLVRAAREALKDDHPSRWWRAELRAEVLLRSVHWFRNGLPVEYTLPADGGGFAAWLRGVLRAECHIVAQEFRGQAVSLGLVVFPPRHCQLTEDPDLCRLWNQIARLPMPERTVFLLRAQGRSLDRIARELRIPRSFAGQLLRRGLRRLRRS